MQRRGMVIFILLNVLISAGVAYAIIQLNPGGDSGEGTERLVTFEVIHTATRDPNMTPEVVFQVVTATEDGDAPIVVPPEDVREGTAVAAGATPAATVDETLIGANPDALLTATGLPPNCILHIVDSGENPSVIADIYGAGLAELLLVNGLDEESALLLQIGDLLIVPLEGCELVPDEPIVVAEDGDNGDEDDDNGDDGDDNGESTPEVTGAPTITPTITLPPTATNAAIQIIEIVGRGDITREQVVLENTGQNVDLTGWTLSDTEGNVYEFPADQFLFSNSTLRVNTRGGGSDTPVVVFWDRDEAVFGEPGDAVILRDADGVTQAVLRLN